MAYDIYLTDRGDFALSQNGDLAVTPDEIERVKQQTQLRLATEIGDFLFYPQLGASLQKLVGLPNTQNTGRFGVELIERTLSYDGFQPRGSVKIEVTPTAREALTFSLRIPIGRRESVQVTLTQLLSL
jgi:hypothetical protein